MPADLPLSVWPTAQRNARAQRAGRYVEISGHHPAKMLPAIATRAIATYTSPGDLVLDPMAGIGSTLVEAVHLGRDAIGVEYEPQWAELARANITYARSQGATGHGEVVCGDARHVTTVVDPAVRGLVALVLTSPPYGPSLHGQVTSPAGSGHRQVPQSVFHRPGQPCPRRPRPAARRHAHHPHRLRLPAPPRRMPGHDRPAVVARRPTIDLPGAMVRVRRGGRARPLQTQRRPARRPARRAAGTPHLVLRPRTGPQSPSGRHARLVTAHEDFLVFRRQALAAAPAVARLTRDEDRDRPTRAASTPGIRLSRATEQPPSRFAAQALTSGPWLRPHRVRWPPKCGSCQQDKEQDGPCSWEPRPTTATLRRDRRAAAGHARERWVDASSRATPPPSESCGAESRMSDRLLTQVEAARLAGCSRDTIVQGPPRRPAAQRPPRGRPLGHPPRRPGHRRAVRPARVGRHPDVRAVSVRPSGGH